MKKVHWGVLGTAGIARSQTIPGMQMTENCLLYGIAGRDPEKVRAFKKTFGFEKAYVRYEDLLADPEIEAVYIPLPNHLHGEWTIRALEAGKHVLCEKPLATSEAEALRMFEAAEKNGVWLMEAFAYLHSPLIEAIKTDLNAGVIGEIRYLDSAFITGRPGETNIRLQRETCGGAFFDLGCYPLSLALYLIGREPEQVKAAASFSDKRIDLYTSALLVYDSGTVASLSCGMVLPSGRMDRLQIRGTRGEIISPMHYNESGELSYTIFTDEKTETRTISVPNNYALEVAQLGDCILNGKRPHVTREFSLMTARTTDRILAAIGY